jgi:hypothetical protein
MSSDIHPDRNTAMRWCVWLGAGLIVWSAIMYWSLILYPKDLSVNGDRPMLSIELPTNDSSLRVALGDGREDSEQILDAVKLNTYLDFVFICLYTAFLATFTCWITWEPRRVVRGFTVFLYGFLMLAALGDSLENIGILNAANALGGAGAIRIPSEIKWAALSIAIVSLGVYLLSRQHRIAGAVLALLGGVIMAGLLTAHHSLMARSVVIALLSALLLTIYNRLSPAPDRADEGRVIPANKVLLEELEELFSTFKVTDPDKFLTWLRTDAEINPEVFDDIPDLKTLSDWVSSGGASLPENCAARIEDSAKRIVHYQKTILRKTASSSPRPPAFNIKQFMERAKKIVRYQKTISKETLPTSPPQSPFDFRQFIQQAFRLDAPESDQTTIQQENLRILENHGVVFSQAHFSDTPEITGLKHSAICLSGGGIRSATFNLGILQALQRQRILELFHYLSTVSGGGFIGGWFSALKHRGPTQGISNSTCAVKYLRQYSSYLNPRGGLLSADTWTLVTVYLRNLVLTWAVVLPCMAGALVAPQLIRRFYGVKPDAGVASLVLISSVVALIIGVGYIAAHLPFNDLSEDSLEKLRTIVRWGAFFVLFLADIGYGLWHVFPRKWFVPVVLLQLFVVPLFFARKRAAQDADFVSRALLPMVVSAVGFTAVWNWIVKEGPLADPRIFLIGGTVSVFVSWLMPSLYALTHRAADEQEVDFRLGLSLLALPSAAAMASLLAWFLGTRRWFNYSAELYTVFAVPILIGVFLGGGTAMAGAISRRTTAEDEEWWARAGAWLLMAAVGWMIVSGCVLYLPDGLGWLMKEIRTAPLGPKAALKGLAAIFGGISAIVSAVAGFSRKTGKTNDGDTGVVTLLASIGAAVGLVYIFGYITLLTDRIIEALAYRVGVDHRNPLLLGGTMLAFLIIGGLAGIAINTNKFSLHYYWRNRIVRAYLGASAGPIPDAARFTGFTEKDNLQMHELLGQRPFHVLNLALNLTDTRNLAWQERQAESFTISPLHCGNADLGYRSSALYGRVKFSGVQGISLGTAMALSGAAVSPNMGYMVSSPILRFLMTLFNLRLGAWLGNPGAAGDTTFQQSAPTHSVGPILREAFGLINNTSPYVYLSDGGHFENLGMYEMVRRKCRTILVSDASTDPDFDFESLAVSIRKIRIDFDVSIEIHRAAPIGRQKEEPGSYFALGSILYSKSSQEEFNGFADGYLIYIKASLTGTESEDIQNYHRAHPTFPQESIADQFFTESQFESYRALGHHIVSTMCQDETGTLLEFNDLDAFYKHLRGAQTGVLDELVAAIKAAAASAS